MLATLVTIEMTHPLEKDANEDLITQTLRFGTVGFAAGPSGAPTNAVFAPVLKDHPTMEWALFGSGQTRGASRDFGACKFSTPMVAMTIDRLVRRPLAGDGDDRRDRRPGAADKRFRGHPDR